MAFANLTAATYGCTATMYARWVAGTLQADLTAFAVAVAPVFADDNPNDRTVGDWLILVQAIASKMTPALFVGADQAIVDASIQIAYRMFAQTNARSGVNGQISAGQAAAVLAAANAHLS